MHRAKQENVNTKVK